MNFINIRGLSAADKEKVRGYFASYIKARGVDGDMSSVQGEIFGLVKEGRVIAGAWVRHWPTDPKTGDVHVVLAQSRFSDFKTLVAFDLFLSERAEIMGLKRWRIAVEEGNQYAIRALLYLRFREVARGTYPVLGSARILEREVI